MLESNLSVSPELQVRIPRGLDENTAVEALRKYSDVHVLRFADAKNAFSHFSRPRFQERFEVGHPPGNSVKFPHDPVLHQRQQCFGHFLRPRYQEAWTSHSAVAAHKLDALFVLVVFLFITVCLPPLSIPRASSGACVLRAAGAAGRVLHVPFRCL